MVGLPRPTRQFSRSPVLACAKQSLARAGHVFRAKPAAAAANPPPKGPQYRLLPPYTVRRFLRPKVRLRSGQRSMFAHPIRRIRPETYKPLPDGWVWPPIPTQSDLPYIPRKKKRKRRIPQSVLDEWKGFSRPKSSLEGLVQPPGRLPSHPQMRSTPRARRVTHTTQTKSRILIPPKAKFLMMRFLTTLGSWDLMMKPRSLMRH